MRLLVRFFIILLAIVVGFYPLLYLLSSAKIALLGSKSDDLLANFFWRLGFYTHIVFGGLALMIGWAQFITTWRFKYPQRHKNLGFLYVLFCWLSGLAAVCISFAATGGYVAMLGFMFLGFFWLYTTTQAYFAIRNKKFALHEKLMIYSYAACFAAVTLRIYLPSLTYLLGDFMAAYVIVAWLCWLPNVLIAYFWIRFSGHKFHS